MVRYVLISELVERFVKFLDMESHWTTRLNLKKNGIDIKNCHEQSYENISDMSGKYHDLPARIRR